jgi:Mrp family chromosome partitioning ATPase
VTIAPDTLAYAAELEDRNAELQRMLTGLLVSVAARRELEQFAESEIAAMNGKPDYVWQPTPLTEAAADPPPRPDRFGNLIYKSAATLVSGEPGVGKSMFLAAMVAEEAVAGRTALYLDFEGSAGTLAERLEAAALSEEQLACVLYLRPTSQAKPDEIRAMIAHTAPVRAAGRAALGRHGPRPLAARRRPRS